MTGSPSHMLGITRCASAPDFSQWYNYKAERRLEEELAKSSSYTDEISQSRDEIFSKFNDTSRSSSVSFQPPLQTSVETQTHRYPIVPNSPSALTFHSYVYVLAGIQVSVASLQWLATTYQWQPKFSTSERKVYVLILFLTWCNILFGFLGFRRLQMKFPLNWIIFFCIFESLTLLILCLCVHELDLTWHFMILGILVLVTYTLMGLWVPALLTADLWILIFASITVLITAIIAITSGLAMRFYVPLTICMILFGPWAMYNSQNVHKVQRKGYCTRSYLSAAIKIYVNYGCTVGGTVLVYRLAAESIEDEDCKNSVFCTKRAMHPINL